VYASDDLSRSHVKFSINQCARSLLNEAVVSRDLVSEPRTERHTLLQSLEFILDLLLR